MKTSKILILFLIAVSFSISISFSAVGQYSIPNIDEALKPAIIIEDIRLLGEAKRGDSFEILVRYKPLLDTKGTVIFRAPEHVDLSDKALGVRTITEARTFQKERTVIERFMVKANETGRGVYHVIIDIPTAPIDYQRSVERWIAIESTEDGYDVFDPLNPGDRQPKVIGEDIILIIGDGHDTEDNDSQNMQIQSSQNYNVSVSGMLRFFTGEPEFTYRGVFGNGVRLWFRNSNNPGTWYHPISGNTKGVHYDILDGNGNFSFNFNFTGNLSAYNQVIVIVGADNSAMFMPAPPDGYIVWENNSYKAYYHESNGIVAAFNPAHSNITINQTNNNFPSDHGKLYRYMQLSRELVVNLYNGNIPFNLPPIYTRIYNLPTGTAGIFCQSKNCTGYPAQPYGPYIFIDPIVGTQIKTISHEYGHKVNFRIWGSNGSKMANAPLDLKEGWAEFFSFATRNYANRSYGDDLMRGRSNGEEGPFITPYRYVGFSYLTTDRKVAAFASYLWNLYDDVSSSLFLAPLYNNGDNDDINGHSVRLFERMRTLGTTSISNYHNHFKSGLPSDEQTSINRVYSFMFDDLYNQPSTKMRSSQVRNASFNVVSGTRIDFTWTTGSYSGNPYYRNYETGYRIYERVGTNWNLIATRPAGTTSYSHTTAAIRPQYKITSYNSSGESFNPAILYTIPSAPYITLDASGMNPKLNWNAVSGADLYKIYYGSIQGAPGTVSCSMVWDYWYQGSTTSTTYTDHSVWIDPSSNILACYYVTSVNQTGESNPSNKVGVHGMAPLKEDELIAAETISLPREYAIHDNYPNPFNPVTTISYDIPEPSAVSLVIYDIMGREVQRLVDGIIEPGYHSATWNARSAMGVEVSSGIYIYRFTARPVSGESTAEGLHYLKKMLLTK